MAKEATPRSLGRSFWILWTATAATSLGDGIRLVALPLLATEATDRPSLIALVTVFTYAAGLVFGLPAGVLVDRWRKRRIIAVAHSLRALVLAVLSVVVWTDYLNLPVLCVAALLYGVGEAFADPASVALLPRLVKPALLGKANSRIQLGQNAMEDFVGTAAGGVLFSLSLAAPLAINVLLLFAAATVVLRLPRAGTEASAGLQGVRRTSLWREGIEGYAMVLRSPLLVRMSVMVAAWSLTYGAFNGVSAVYALRTLEAGASGLGLMLSLGAVGALAGSLVAVKVIRALGGALTIAVSVTSCGVAMLALSWTHELWLAAALLALNGVATMVWNVLSSTIRQSLVPHLLLGRVTAVYRLLPMVSLPLGAGVGGLAADGFGAPAVLALAGAVLLAVAVLLVPGLWTLVQPVWPRGSDVVSQGVLERPAHRVSC